MKFLKWLGFDPKSIASGRRFSPGCSCRPLSDIFVTHRLKSDVREIIEMPNTDRRTPRGWISFNLLSFEMRIAIKKSLFSYDLS